MSAHAPQCHHAVGDEIVHQHVVEIERRDPDRQIEQTLRVGIQAFVQADAGQRIQAARVARIGGNGRDQRGGDLVQTVTRAHLVAGQRLRGRREAGIKLHRFLQPTRPTLHVTAPLAQQRKLEGESRGDGVADALASGWLQQLVEGRNALVRSRSAFGRITQSAETDHLIVRLQTTQLIQRRLHRDPTGRKAFIRGLGDALHHAPALTVVGHQFGRGERHIQCTKETGGDGAAGLRDQADGGATPGHAETAAGLQIDQCIGAQGKRGDQKGCGDGHRGTSVAAVALTLATPNR